MSNMQQTRFHSKQTRSDGIHTPIAFSYANQSVRTAATGFTSFDLNKFAIQEDDKSVWMLVSISLVEWSLVSSTVTGISEELAIAYAVAL